MEEKRLNDELTIVGLVFLIFFIIYYLCIHAYQSYRLEKRLTETQKIAIMLDKRLTKAEEKLDISQEKIINLQSQIEENKQIDAITKDIATYWYFGREN